MHQNAVFLFLGDDPRSRYAALALAGRGCRVADCAVREADVIVLPMGTPVSPALLQELRPGQTVLGGYIDLPREAPDGCAILDYYADTLLPYANAVPTAEGAIALLLEHLPVTVQGAHGLITGYGRIGSVLAQKLRLLGGEITVSARREADIGEILAAGLRAERTGSYRFPLDSYDYVVNTVPTPVFSDYSRFQKGCLMLELASRPGGIDETQCGGLSYIHAPGLPGKYAPRTAGNAIADAIARILKLEESSCDMKP